MARIRPTDWLLSLASGALLAAVQPPWSLAPLAWIALVPLLLALDGKRSGARILLGLFCGTVWAWCVVGRWLWPAATLVLPVSNLTAFGLTGVAVEAFGGMYVALFACLYRRRFMRLSAGACLALPALWVGIELLRAHAFNGVPWALLGHSQWTQTTVIQVADSTGVYGVTFVLVAVNFFVAQGIMAVWQKAFGLRQIAAGLVVVTLVAAVWAYGAWRLRVPATASDTLTVQAVHTAWADDAPGSAQRLLEHLLHVTEQVPPDAASLVVWPENSMRFYVQDEAEAAAAVAALAKRRQQFLLVGGPRYRRTVAGNWYYNSAYLFTPDGEMERVHDKRLLVPLAESHFGRLPRVERPFHPGRSWRPWHVGAPRLGVLICFEAIFAYPAQALVREGARMLINISNDQLVGAGAGQQAAMGIFRTVENRVPLVRVSNLGPSLLVDSFGRVVAYETGDSNASQWTVALGSGTTPYNRWGDVFAGFCASMAALYWLIALWAPRTRVRD